MKKTICLLAACALLLAACTAPQSGSPAPHSGENIAPLTEDALLLQMRAALMTEGAGPYSFTLVGPPFEGIDGMRVRQSGELLEKLADLLTRGDAAPSDANSFGADGVVQTILIQGGQPHLAIQLYRTTADTTPGGDGTLLFLQVGEESGSYQYGPDVYDSVGQQLQGSLVPARQGVEAESAVAMNPPAQADAVYTAWLECGQVLAGLFSWQPSENSNESLSAVELFSTAGESLYYEEFAAEALFMERAEGVESADLRIVLADGSVRYLDSQNPEAPFAADHLPEDLLARYQAPIALDRPVYRFFDGGRDKGGVWAATDENGLTIVKDDGSRDFVSNDAMIGQLEWDLASSAATPPQFGEVRIMNGGKTLAAVVMLPQSQMGQAGIYLRDIASGAEHWYFGMFRPMLAHTVFLDDGHIVVPTEDILYRLDVATAEMTEEAAPPDMMLATTADFVHFVYYDYQQADDGGESVLLHTGNADAPFLTAYGGFSQLHLKGVTDHYALVCYYGEGDAQWFLCRWR